MRKVLPLITLSLLLVGCDSRDAQIKENCSLALSDAGSSYFSVVKLRRLMGISRDDLWDAEAFCIEYQKYD